MPVSIHPSRKAWLGLVGVILVALVAVAWQSVLSSPSASSAILQLPPPPQVNGIYLADPQTPVVRPEQAREYGVRVVSSVPDLVAGALTADALIIDATRFDRVDALWLATQLRDGKVIAALNVPFTRLAALPGYRQPPTPLEYRQDWGGRPFFSFVRQWQDSRGVMHLSTGSDYLNSPGDFFRRVYQVTPAGVEASSRSMPSPDTHALLLPAAKRSCIYQSIQR